MREENRPRQLRQQPLRDAMSFATIYAKHRFVPRDGATPTLRRHRERPSQRPSSPRTAPLSRLSVCIQPGNEQSRIRSRGVAGHHARADIHPPPVRTSHIKGRLPRASGERRWRPDLPQPRRPRTSHHRRPFREARRVDRLPLQLPPQSRDGLDPPPDRRSTRRGDTTTGHMTNESGARSYRVGIPRYTNLGRGRTVKPASGAPR